MAVSAIRTVVIYVVLIAAMRIMGKRQLSDMQPTELAVTLMIADLATVPMQETGIPLLSGLVPIFVLLALELFLSGAMLKWPFLSRLASGNPVVIVQDGVLRQKALGRMRITVEDLFENLRSQGYFDLKEIEYAIAETNGSISVLPKPAYRPVINRDMAVTLPDDGIPLVVVSDGKICTWALPLCEVEETWVYTVLAKEKKTLREVFLMTADRSRHYWILTKSKETVSS